MPSLLNDLCGLGSMFGQPPKRNTTQRQLDLILGMYSNMYQGLGNQAAQARQERYSSLASQQIRAGDMLAAQMGSYWVKCGYSDAAPVVVPKDPCREDAEIEYCEFAMIPRNHLFDKSDPFGVFA